MEFNKHGYRCPADLFAFSNHILKLKKVIGFNYAWHVPRKEKDYPYYLKRYLEIRLWYHYTGNIVIYVDQKFIIEQQNLI
jgi:hypothetical protein